jgi:uncharacterized integral membrane protein
MLGLIFALPFLLFLVIFALSNRATVTLHLWPTDLALVAPLSLAILVASAIFFVLGAIVMGLSSMRNRARARRAERRVRALEIELERLRPRQTIPGTNVAVRTIAG